jgi:hypothetical protein
VILVTARAGEEAAIEGLVAGADDYIAKPFSARELVARIAAQLELSRARRKTEALLKARNAELRGQREALEAAVNGAPLEVSLGALARTAIASLDQQVRAAFYLANEDGTSFHHVVGITAESAENVGYRGCWSFPIDSVAGKVVGKLAIYWREPRETTQADLDLAVLITHTASIIITRHAENLRSSGAS